MLYLNIHGAAIKNLTLHKMDGELPSAIIFAETFSKSFPPNSQYFAKKIRVQDKLPKYVKVDQTK